MYIPVCRFHDCTHDFMLHNPFTSPTQYSLEFFKALFLNTIANSEQLEDKEAKLDLYIDNITQAVYTNVCRGLFEQHKPMFSFLMCTSVLVRCVCHSCMSHAICTLWGISGSESTHPICACCFVEELTFWRIHNVTTGHKLAIFSVCLHSQCTCCVRSFYFSMGMEFVRGGSSLLPSFMLLANSCACYLHLLRGCAA